MKAAILAGVMMTFAIPVNAQRDSLLVAAVELAAEGQSDSARAIVRRRLVDLSPRDSLYPEALYTAGVVAGNLDSAMLYLRTVSIEHMRSPWADHALLRLAQLSFATRDHDGARRAAERILMDYPFSDVAADAGFWAGRANLELGNLAEACAQLAEAERRAGDDPELQTRIQFYGPRCTDVAPPPVADTAVTDTAETIPRNVIYSVQVAAVTSPMAADEVMRDLAALGYQPHVLREDNYFKIRVGRLADRSAAQTLAQELKGKFGGSPFVVTQP